MVCRLCSDLEALQRVRWGQVFPNRADSIPVDSCHAPVVACRVASRKYMRETAEEPASRPAGRQARQMLTKIREQH